MSKIETSSIQHRLPGCCQLFLIGLVIGLVGLLCQVAHTRDIGMFNDPSLGVDVVIDKAHNFRVLPYVGKLAANPADAQGNMWSIAHPEGARVNEDEVSSSGLALLHLGDSSYAVTADEKVCTYQDHVAVAVTQNERLILYASEVPLWIYRCDRFQKIGADLGFGIAHYLAWREQFVAELQQFHSTFINYSDKNANELLQIATNSKSENRQFAIISLASYGKTVVPGLVSMLAREETADTALAVLQMIGNDASDATSPVAALLTGNVVGTEHRRIYRTLETIGAPDREAATLLLQELAKIKLTTAPPVGHPGCIFSALVTVGPDDPRVHQILVKHLRHPHYTIRKAAAIAVGITGRCIPDAVPLLKQNRQRTLLRLSATWALYQMKNAYWKMRYGKKTDGTAQESDTTSACDVTF